MTRITGNRVLVLSCDLPRTMMQRICIYDILIAETLTAKDDDIMIHGLILLKEDTVINEKNMDAYQKFTDCLWAIIPDQYDKLGAIPDKLGILSINSNSMKKKIEVIREAENNNGKLKNKVIVSLLMKHLKNVNYHYID